MRIIAAPIAATLTVLTLAGCQLPDDSKSSSARPPAASSPSTRSSSPAANNGPDPKAKLTGTCDYSLSDTLGGRDTFTAEIDVKNTGNIGVKVKVSASWPQFGFAPLKSTRTVTVPYHKTVTVQLRHSATSTQTLRLQSWQEHHDMEDGCKYHGEILETAGQLH